MVGSRTVEHPKHITAMIVDFYSQMVRAKHGQIPGWPVISGFNFKMAHYGTATIIHLQDTGRRGSTLSGDLGELRPAQVGADLITPANRAAVIERLRGVLNVEPRDMLLVAEEGYIKESESYRIDHEVIVPQLNAAMLQHEVLQGMIPMRIFLSHKGSLRTLGEVRRRFSQDVTLSFDKHMVLSKIEAPESGQ
jgi:hypothetical protein